LNRLLNSLVVFISPDKMLQHIRNRLHALENAQQVRKVRLEVQVSRFNRLKIESRFLGDKGPRGYPGETVCFFEENANLI
jgi:hypothetical protein